MERGETECLTCLRVEVRDRRTNTPLGGKVTIQDESTSQIRCNRTNDGVTSFDVLIGKIYTICVEPLGDVYFPSGCIEVFVERGGAIILKIASIKWDDIKSIIHPSFFAEIYHYVI